MYSKPILTESEYHDLKARYEFYHAEWKRLLGNRNYATPEDQKLLPPSLTSEQISQIEVYEFIHDIPQKYFAYVHQEETSVTYSQKHTYKTPTHITTWTGENLGTITYDSIYRSNFGDLRVNIRVTAINGKKYYGTFYKSAGDYCRLTMCKD